VVTNKQIAIKYADDIIDGKIPACKYIIQACKLFLSYLERSDLIYKDSEVDKVISFINELYLSEESSNLKFILTPWQTLFVAGIYGFYYRSTDTRKTKNVFLLIPKKNGKSQLITALTIYHLIFDTGAQIIIAANSLRQVKKIDWKMVNNYCIQLDPKEKYIKRYYNDIKFRNNELLVISSDAKKIDGYNASTIVVDEIHEAKNGNLYNNLKSGQVSRKEPLCICTTTAGFDSESFCYSLVEYNIKVLSGEIIDDNQWGLLYTLDPEDDYTDYNNIAKANPNLGVSVREDAIIEEIKKSINNPIEAFSVKVKHFNLWLGAKNFDEQYIDLNFVDKVLNKNISIDDDKFNECEEVFIGVDLAAVSDILAATYMFFSDKYYFFNRYYLPKNNQNSIANNKNYTMWADKGYIKLVDGNVIDFSDIIEDIKPIYEKFNIRQISYDPANAVQFAIKGGYEGLNMIPFAQTNVKFNSPAKEFSRLILSEQVEIEYNPVTRWMFSNVIVKEYKELIHLNKKTNNNKIDGVISMITCLGGYLDSPNYSYKVY